MKHITVYGEPGIYAGWPANHGAWQRGDEFLVGFMRGRFERGGVHHVKEPFEKMQARSLDGGETWQLEDPGVSFEAQWDVKVSRVILNEEDIVRLCGVYDHGGENCSLDGGIYLSADFGRTWRGHFNPGLSRGPDEWVTTRTCHLPPLLFITKGVINQFGSDWTECWSYEDGLKFRSIVLKNDVRAAMPAAARLPNGDILVALRRRTFRSECWIDIVRSCDEGLTWSKPSLVGFTGHHNGNPPALINAGGQIVCAYANRDKKEIIASTLTTDGWKEQVIRKGDCTDIGYPRLFQRSDGKLVCVYYWSDAGEEQRIEATIL